MYIMSIFTYSDPKESFFSVFSNYDGLSSS